MHPSQAERDPTLLVLRERAAHGQRRLVFEDGSCGRRSRSAMVRTATSSALGITPPPARSSTEASGSMISWKAKGCLTAATAIGQRNPVLAGIQPRFARIPFHLHPCTIVHQLPAGGSVCRALARLDRPPKAMVCPTKRCAVSVDRQGRRINNPPQIDNLPHNAAEPQVL